MKQPKIPVSALRSKSASMVASGTMPSLETVLTAIASVREKYLLEIREAQRQSKIHVVKPGGQ